MYVATLYLLLAEALKQQKRLFISSNKYLRLLLKNLQKLCIKLQAGPIANIQNVATHSYYK